MRNLVSLVSTAGAFLLAATPLLAIGGVAHAQEAQALRIQVADLDFSRPGATATGTVRSNVPSAGLTP